MLAARKDSEGECSRTGVDAGTGLSMHPEKSESSRGTKT